MEVGAGGWRWVVTWMRATRVAESVIARSGLKTPRSTCEPPKFLREENQIDDVVYRSGCAIGDERSMTLS